MKAISNNVINEIENLVSDCNDDTILRLWAMDRNKDTNRTGYANEVNVKVTKPFGDTKVALIDTPIGVFSVNLHGCTNDSVYAIVTSITENVLSVVPPTNHLITLRPERDDFKTFFDYREIVENFAEGIDKTEDEMVELVEGLFILMDDYELNHKQIAMFVNDCEDDCIVWDALNGTPTDDITEWVLDIKKKTAPNIYIVSQNHGDLETRAKEFNSEKEAVEYLASERDGILTNGIYTPSTIESEEPDCDIKVDNDREFFITNGRGLFDHIYLKRIR